MKAAAAANAACIVGIYGDSDKKLLQDTGVCDYLIEDYMEPLFMTGDIPRDGNRCSWQKKRP